MVFAFDFLVVVRKPHQPSFAESLRWTACYVGLACLFGLSMLWWRPQGEDGAVEFFAGYLTEWSLSIDNLFVFLVILTTFRVPREYRQRVLLVGVALALVFRGAFIAVGAAALAAFSWMFYLFAIALIVTAVSLVREGVAPKEEAEFSENMVLRLLRRFVPSTDGYREGKLVVRERGVRMVTPLLVVMIAIGTTDVLFALDSIPAIFGLTQDPYLVFVVNAFALMGLRQLFFVVEGLLERLVYLSFGLAVILAFIGVKLVLEALHQNTLGFINGGEGLAVPVISTPVSLGVILGVLAVAATASLLATRGKGSAEAADAPGATGETDYTV